MTLDAQEISPTLSEDLTLSQLFGISADFKLDSTAGSDAPNIVKLRKKIPPATSWHSVQAEVATSLTDTLHSGLLEALAQGWAHYQALIDDARESRKSPHTPILSTLAEHAIDSTLHPYVEVFIGPTSIQKIPFDVTLTTTIKGLQLGLQDGKIVSVEMGHCEWKGSIETGGVPLIERHTQPLKLPGYLQLRKPIPLIRD
jgi:hypothetical protein